MLVTLEAFDPAGRSVTLTDDTVPTPSVGYVMLKDTDWGDVDRQVEYSGPRGTLGRVVSNEVTADRVVVLPVRVYGSSKDDLAARVSLLAEVVDTIRGFGGRVVRKASGQSYRQYLRVTGDASMRHTGWTHRRGEVMNTTVVTLTFTCAPFAEGDPLDWEDAFQKDTVTAGKYTFDLGTSGNLKAGGGLLYSPSTFSEFRFVYSYTGHRLVDRFQSLRFSTNPSSLTGVKQGLVFRRRDANNYLAVVWSLAANTFELRKVVGGVTTTTAITVSGGPSTAVGRDYMLAVWTNGDRINVGVKEGFAYVLGGGVSASDLLGVGTGSVTLTGTDAVNHSTAPGYGGVLYLPQVLGDAVSGYRDLPFTAALQWNPGNLGFMDGVPGDAPAVCDIVVGHTATTNDVRQVIAGWSQQRLPHNAIGNNQFQGTLTGGSGSGGWRHTGSAIVSAATSLAKESVVANAWATNRGDVYGKATLPATANSGVAYQIPFDFNHGERWIGFCWAAGNVGTNAQVVFGSATNNATSGVGSLPTSGSPAFYHAILTGETTRPEFGIKITAATATTMYISNPVVFRGRWTNLSAGVNSTVTSIPVTRIPGDWPDSAPFDVMCGTEFMTVTAVDPVALTLTVIRGVDNAPNAHSSGDDIYLLPSYTQRYGTAGHHPGETVFIGENSITVSVNADGDREHSETPNPPDLKALFSIPVDGSAVADRNVDVWACMKPDATATGESIQVESRDRGQWSIWRPEYGSGLITMQNNPAGAFAWWMRLGTLHNPAGVYSVGGNFVEDTGAPLKSYWVMLTPHGRSVYGYTAAGWFGDTRITSDLAIKNAAGVTMGNATGGLIEIPPGQCSFTYRVYDGDDHVTDKQAVVHIAVIPRWQVLRTA